jgi:hypothetical protein
MGVSAGHSRSVDPSDSPSMTIVDGDAPHSGLKQASRSHECRQSATNVILGTDKVLRDLNVFEYKADKTVPGCQNYELIHMQRAATNKQTIFQRVVRNLHVCGPRVHAPKCMARLAPLDERMQMAVRKIYEFSSNSCLRTS